MLGTLEQGSITVLQLILSFVWALGLVLVFFFQRTKDIRYYFSFGELIYGLRTSIRPLSFVIRLLLLLLYASVISAVHNDVLISQLAMALGGFLIVWPGFLHSDIHDPRFSDRRPLVYGLYVFFVVLCWLAGKSGYTIYSIASPLLQGYFQELPGRLTTFLLDGILFSVVGAVLYWLFRVSNKVVEIKVREQFGDEDSFDNGG